MTAACALRCAAGNENSGPRRPLTQRPHPTQVHHALCIPFSEHVAVKISNLESAPAADLAAAAQEAALMRRFAHPNVLPLHAAFVHGCELWMVMPYMGAGSVRAVMRRKFEAVSGARAKHRLYSQPAPAGCCRGHCSSWLLEAADASCRHPPNTHTGPARAGHRNHHPRGALRAFDNCLPTPPSFTHTTP